MTNKYPNTLLLILRDRAEFIYWQEYMMPFKTAIPVTPHWGEVITKEDKAEFLRAYIKATKERYEESKDGDYPDWIKEGRIPDPEEARKNVFLHEEPEFFEWDNYWGEDENGVQRWWIEYEKNPQGIWTGGGIGGGKLLLKDNSRIAPHVRNQFVATINNHPRASDIGCKGDVVNLKELEFNSVLLDDVWHFVDGSVFDLVKDLPDDVLFMCIVY